MLGILLKYYLDNYCNLLAWLQMSMFDHGHSDGLHAPDPCAAFIPSRAAVSSSSDSSLEPFRIQSKYCITKDEISPMLAKYPPNLK